MSSDARFCGEGNSGPPATQRRNEDNDEGAVTNLNPGSASGINHSVTPWVPQALPGYLPTHHGLDSFAPQSFAALHLNPSIPVGNINASFGPVGALPSGLASGPLELSSDTTLHTHPGLLDATAGHLWSAGLPGEGMTPFFQTGIAGTVNPVDQVPSSAWANQELFNLPYPYYSNQSDQLSNLLLAPPHLNLVAPAQPHHPLTEAQQVPPSVHHAVQAFNVPHEDAVSTEPRKTEASRSPVGPEVNVPELSGGSPSLVCFGMVSKLV